MEPHDSEGPTSKFFHGYSSRNSNSANSNGRNLPGHAVVMQSDAPFRGLSCFGNNFLTKFQAVEVCGL